MKLFVFFFKQKTAYEIKECDWSSDVCSSDLMIGCCGKSIKYIDLCKVILFNFVKWLYTVSNLTRENKERTAG